MRDEERDVIVVTVNLPQTSRPVLSPPPESTSGVDVRQVIAEAICDASFSEDFDAYNYGPTIDHAAAEFLADAVLAALPGLEAT